MNMQIHNQTEKTFTLTGGQEVGINSSIVVHSSFITDEDMSNLEEKDGVYFVVNANASDEEAKTSAGIDLTKLNFKDLLSYAIDNGVKVGNEKSKAGLLLLIEKHGVN